MFLDFKRGYKQKGIVNVHLYQLMCHVLGLTPAPHNGSWQLVQDMLRHHQGAPTGLAEPARMVLLGTVVTCTTALIVIVVGIYVHKRCHRKRGLNYTALALNVPDHD